MFNLQKIVLHFIQGSNRCCMLFCSTVCNLRSSNILDALHIWQLIFDLFQFYIRDIFAKDAKPCNSILTGALHKFYNKAVSLTFLFGALTNYLNESERIVHFSCYVIYIFGQE